MAAYENPTPEKQTGVIVLMCAGLVALAVVVAGAVRLMVLRKDTPASAIPIAATQPKPDPAAARPRTAAPATPAAAPAAPAAPSVASGEDSEDLLTQLRRKLALSNSPNDITTALTELAQSNPRQAIEFAERLGRTGTEKLTFLSAVLRIWAEHDPQRAWDWSLQQGHRLEVPGETSLVATALEATAVSNPRVVLSSVKELLAKNDETTGFSSQEVSYFAIDALIKSGHIDLAQSAVDEWLQTNAGEKIGNAAIERLAVQIAEKSPQQAATWLEKLPATEGRNFAAATLAASWASSDPKGAMTWASSLDANSGRLDAMQRAFNRWAESNRVEAANWLEKNEADPISDRLIYSFVSDSTLAHSNPKVAVQWAELINDETMRAQSVEQVAAAWGATDAAAAKKYIAESTLLTAEQKQRLLRNFGAPPP
jgi:hypothetical protein